MEENKNRSYFKPAENLIDQIKSCETIREIEYLMLLRKQEIETYIAIEEDYRHDFSQVKYLQICSVVTPPCHCIAEAKHLFRFYCEKSSCPRLLAQGISKGIDDSINNAIA